MAVVLCSIILLLSGNAAADTEVVTDDENDVRFVDTYGMEENIADWEKTDEKPNIDIVKLSFIRTEQSTTVTLKLEVNSKGHIEDTNTFNESADDMNLTGSMVSYLMLLKTSTKEYTIEYSDGTCYVNSDIVTPVVSGSELSVTFNLTDVNETFVSLTGYTYEFEINSLVDMKIYIDIAPDEALFVADAGGPYSGKVGEEIQFSGEYVDLLEFTTGPYTYEWDFNDGSTGTGQNPTHKYSHPGTYNVTLTITDSAGNIATDTAEVEITKSSGTNNGNSNTDGTGNSSDSGLMLFIIIIAIIIIVGVVALIVIIRR